MSSEFTGRRMLFVVVGAFGLIIAVNLYMAYRAVSTFPGLEVKNSYVASQSFDKDRAAQQALGWRASTEYRDGVLTLNILDKNGKPAMDVGRINALVARPTHVRDDVVPEFQRHSGLYTAPLELNPGKWELRIKIKSLDGVDFKQRLDFFVKG